MQRNDRLARTVRLRLETLEGRLAPAASIAYSLDVSTYLGGSLFEHVRDVTTDSQGNIYIAGGTESANFPVTPGAYQTIHNPGNPDSSATYRFDAFVMKFRPDGSLVWSTFLGGRNYDRAYAIEVDSQGYVYVAGRAGAGFPVTSAAFQRQFQGGQEAPFYGPQDGFIAKLAPDGGSLVWASYFGTSDPRIIRDIALDAAGNVYLGSGHSSGAWTSAVSTAFANGFQSTPRGGNDGVVAKVRSDGTQVLWASYLGGSGNEYGTPSVRVDAAGSVYVLYSTNSTDMPATSGAYDRTSNGGYDSFLAKFTPDGHGLVYGTYLGGSGNEDGETHNLAIDAQGRAYALVVTTSANLPTTPGALQRTLGGSTDAAVLKLSADGSQLLAGTYLGGSGSEGGEGVSVDARGNVYVSGPTASSNFPVTADAYQNARRGGQDFYAAVLRPNLSSLAYATYLGGSGDDYPRSSFADAQGNFYVAGQTNSTDFPGRHDIQPNYGGGTVDAAFVKFAARPVSPVHDTSNLPIAGTRPFASAPADSPWAFTSATWGSGTASEFATDNLDATQVAQAFPLPAAGVLAESSQSARRRNDQPSGNQQVRVLVAGPDDRKATPSETGSRCPTTSRASRAAGTHTTILEGPVDGHATASLPRQHR